MENETDVIRSQMLETRTSLTEKLEALEEKVVATVQGTTETVQEAVQAVTDTVQDTVSNVSESVQDTVESVKSTFDISRQFQQHPWGMFGGAVVVGFLAGRLLPSTSTLTHAASSLVGAAGMGTQGGMSGAGMHGPSMAGMGPGWYGTAGAVPGGAGTPNTANPLGTSDGYQSPSSPAAYSSPAAAPTPAPAAAPGGTSTSESSGWFGNLSESFAPVAHQLQGMAIGTLAGLAGEMVMRSAPENYRPQLADWIQELTKALGGEPIPGVFDAYLQPGNGQQGQPGQRGRQHPAGRTV